jgi:hypothetical protein
MDGRNIDRLNFTIWLSGGGNMKIEFDASLSQGSSAVKIDGKDGNAKITLEIAASELAEVLKVPAYLRERSFHVIFEAIEV